MTCLDRLNSVQEKATVEVMLRQGTNTSIISLVMHANMTNTKYYVRDLLFMYVFMCVTNKQKLLTFSLV